MSRCLHALRRPRPRRVRTAPILGALALLCAPAAQAGAPTLELRDPLGAARAALGAGRLDEAEAALAAAGVQAPGLGARIAAARGDKAGACALYAADRSSSRGPAATLRAARCLTAQSDVEGARAAWRVVASGPFAQDARVLEEMGAFLAGRGLPLDALTRALDLRVGTFDEEQRTALSHVLLILVERAEPAIAARALERLLVELSDTDAATRARNTGGAAQRPAEDLATALARARALADRHESDAVVKALAPFTLGTDEVGCEARLLRAKAWRKLRKYAAARKELDAIAARCNDDVAKRGRYLAARVASLSKAASAAPTLRAFAERWPEDPLTDDVLLWLGESLWRARDGSGAEQAWEQALRQFPSGDQAHEIRFRLAWAKAERGDGAGARALLDDAARAAGARVDLVDRATYWRARLALCPDLRSLEPDRCLKEGKARVEALEALQAFATQRPASWYGHLARLLLLRETRTAGKAAPAVPSLRLLRSQAARSTLTPSAALAADGRFALAVELVAGGYDDEALRLLRATDLPRASTEDALAVALLVARAGKPGDGHALLRGAGLGLLPGSPSSETAHAWDLAWPRAYASAIEAAADAHRVPRPLLFGLAREESTFDADVVSWAGAVGLCQLMPATAADEAQALKLARPDVEALRDPHLNARLGAAHLGRRLQGMRHPMLAIAAYNAGPGGVAKWAPSGPLDAWVEQIPVDETRNYVKKVTGSWVTYATLDGSIDDVTFPLVLR